MGQLPIKDPVKRREYHRAYSKRHYRRNKVYYLAKARRHRKVSTTRSQQFLRLYKLLWGCTDCGYDAHSYALECDHLPQFEKVAAVSSLVDSPEKMCAELEKCDVRCANCHRIVTQERKTTGL